MNFKYLLLLFSAAFFFSSTYESNPSEFARIDLIFILCLLAFVLGVECLIVRMISRSRMASSVVLAVFITINLYYLNLILSEKFFSLSLHMQVLALLTVTALGTVLASIMENNTPIAKALLGFFAVATAVALVQSILSVAPVPKVSIESGKTSAENIQIVDFKTKPNVYFISFDSLIPKTILQNHLGLETTPYHEVLDPNFRHFKNFFADYPNTRLSLNSLLALDTEHFSRARTDGTELYFFPGLIPSPLLEIFKHNGYETTTSYKALHLGHKKGPYVDNYRVNRWDLKEGVCNFIESSGLKAGTLMGYCYLVNNRILESALLDFEGSKEQEEVDFLLNNMRSGLHKNGPQVFVAYIYSPGHTFFGFDRERVEDLKKYRDFYLHASGQTARFLKKIITFVKQEDPEAIVFIFGDHGPHMSSQDGTDSDAIFSVKDNFGVYGGIYPPDRCAEYFATPYSEEYMTVSQAALTIVKCLAGGKDAFLKKREYRLPSEFITGDNDRYEKFLYE